MKTMYSRIAGLTFRENIPWDQIQAGDSLTLIHDDCGKRSGIKHPDPTALMVVHDKTKFHLGFIPAPTAKLLLDEIKASLFRCRVEEVTGGYGDKRNFGVNINICYEVE